MEDQTIEIGKITRDFLVRQKNIADAIPNLPSVTVPEELSRLLAAPIPMFRIDELQELTKNEERRKRAVQNAAIEGAAQMRGVATHLVALTAQSNRQNDTIQAMFLYAQARDRKADRFNRKLFVVAVAGLIVGILSLIR